jgi:hypothetical protein
LLARTEIDEIGIVTGAISQLNLSAKRFTHVADAACPASALCRPFDSLPVCTALASSVRLEPPLALALAPPLLLLLLPPLAAFTSAATLVAPAAVLSVLEAEAEDSAATLELEAEPPPLAAALSVLVPAEAEDSAAMLELEAEVDAATAVSTLVEAPFWPEPPPPLNLAALVWRRLAQRANTYGDL